MDKCITCSNRVGDNYCTMQLDMNLAQYKQCQNYKIIIKEKKEQDKLLKVIIPKKEETEMETDKDWQKFLKKGGSYSFRTKQYLSINSNKTDTKDT